MYLNNLTTNLAYEVKVKAGTRSHIGSGELHLGDWSPVSAVYLQPGCETMKEINSIHFSYNYLASSELP